MINLILFQFMRMHLVNRVPWEKKNALLKDLICVIYCVSIC